MNIEGMLDAVKLFPAYNEKMQKNVTEIVNECQNIQDEDRWVADHFLWALVIRWINIFRCELADKLINCFMDGAKKRGIERVFGSVMIWRIT